MRKYIFILWVLSMLFSCKKKIDGVLVKDLSISTEADFDKVRFIGDNAIIVGGKRYDESLIYILKSDNILEKISVPNNATNKEIYGIDISPLGKIIAVGYDASVYVSSDSGYHWNFIQNGTWENFQDVAFRDKDTAFIVSNKTFAEGAIIATDKDGTGPNMPTERRNFSIDEIDFINPATGYLCGYGAIMKTTDGGRTWTFTTAKNDYFKSMSWKNEQEGVAVGYAGSILQTSDGGDTWQTNRNGNNFLKKKFHFLSVENNGKDTYAAVGEKGIVCVSYNRGNTWQEVKKFTDKDLKGLYFKNENECVVVGAKGALFLLKF